MSKHMKLVAVTSVALVAAPFLGVGVVYAAHRRDETAFLANVNMWDTHANRVAVRETPDLVIAEGDKACKWLRDQSWVLFDEEHGRREASLRTQYLAEVAQASLTPVSAGSLGPNVGARAESRQRRQLSRAASREEFLVDTAWHHLCGGTLQFRIGFGYPFNAPED